MRNSRTKKSGTAKTVIKTITRNLSLGSKSSELLDDIAKRLNTTPSHAARIAISLLAKQPNVSTVELMTAAK